VGAAWALRGRRGGSAVAVRCGGLLVLAVLFVALSVVTFRSYTKKV
jgi:hypothetical protein